MLNLMFPSYARHAVRRPARDDSFFSDFWDATTPPWPAVDIHELADRFVLKADVPGVEEKDIRVEFKDGALVIEGSRAAEKETVEKAEKGELRVHLRERRQSEFRRAFELGDTVDAEKILANYRNGTLTVEIPKAPRALARTIPIKTLDP